MVSRSGELLGDAQSIDATIHTIDSGCQSEQAHPQVGRIWLMVNQYLP
jgi:hypothetical protein